MEWVQIILGHGFELLIRWMVSGELRGEDVNLNIISRHLSEF